MARRLKIKLVEWGIANRYNSTIEVHKDLPKYPRLFKPIMLHEISHTSKPGFSWKDFYIDFSGKHTQNINRLELYKFMLNRPKTWIQFLPFYYQPSKGFVYDLNKMIFWVIITSALIFDLVLIKRLI